MVKKTGDRLEDFFEECWGFYRRPMSRFTKTIVRRYDAYLIKQELLEKKEVKKTNLIDPVKKIIEEMVDYPPEARDNPVFSEPKDIAFIHEDVGHLTGGRYYAYFVISALLELGHTVTVYTNRKAVFSNEFKKYKKPKFKIAAKNASQLSTIDAKADIYIGSPIHGNITASRLGQKYRKPSFALIYDPFPMMEKYLGRRKYPGWQQLLSILRKNNTEIISLCNIPTAYIYSWLNKTKKQVHPVYPCINSKVYDKKSRINKREDYALFISRLVGHKRFEDVVIACKKTNTKLKVISSANGISASKIVNKHDMQDMVEFHLKVTDDVKFDMISKAAVVINGSIFEGFGMYLAEAITSGTPFVGYDYPTFREIAKYAKVDNIYLAKPKDTDDLAKKLQKAIDDQNFSDEKTVFSFELMVERLRGI